MKHELPPFGPLVDDVDCVRIIAGGKCGAPTTWHIIWTHDGEHALACEEHALEAARDFRPVQVHRRAPDCGMPGAYWYPMEATCRVPPELDPLPPDPALESLVPPLFRELFIPDRLPERSGV